MSVADASVAERIESHFRAVGVAAAPRQIAQLASYFGLLTKWNKTVNLTALDLDLPNPGTLDRLFVEPFLAAAAIRKVHEAGAGASGPSTRLLDVGSGGGSPAIPLAIALEQTSGLRMVESRGRKAAFLREVIRQLPLDGAEVFAERLEALVDRPGLSESVDLVSIRAVRADRDLWKSLAYLVRPGGFVLWFRTAADANTDPVFFPHFLLHSVEALVPPDSELGVLRRT